MCHVTDRTTAKTEVTDACERAINYVNELDQSLNHTSVHHFCTLAREAYDVDPNVQISTENQFSCLTDDVANDAFNTTNLGLLMSKRVHTTDWCREHVGHPGCNKAMSKDSQHLPLEIKEGEASEASVESELKDMGEWKIHMCEIMVKGHVAFLPPICESVAKKLGVHIEPSARRVCFGEYADCMHNPTTKHSDCKKNKASCLKKKTL